MDYPAILSHIRLQDVVDIFFLTAVAYYFYLCFRGTRALRALVGLAALGIVYAVARFWGLFLTTWVLQLLWQALIILLIILFQSEIRQVLERANPLQLIGLRRPRPPVAWLEGLAQACFWLANRRIGALLVFERLDGVGQWLTNGVKLEAEPGPELLLSVFQKNSPLHDGAMVIRAGKVVRVACYLPLSTAEGLPSEWGTRHRAALGLVETCDAWVVVVSEERGEVSVARAGELLPVQDPQRLTRFLLEAFAPPGPEGETAWAKIRSLLFHRWQAKLATLGLVSMVWLLLAGQQNFEVTLRVPVEVTNLPAQLQIVQPVAPTAKITVRGLRKDASTLSAANVRAELDLSLARLGRRTYRLSREDVVLPNRRVNIVKIEPTKLFFTFKERKPG